MAMDFRPDPLKAALARIDALVNDNRANEMGERQITENFATPADWLEYRERLRRVEPGRRSLIDAALTNWAHGRAALPQTEDRDTWFLIFRRFSHAFIEGSRLDAELTGEDRAARSEAEWLVYLLVESWAGRSGSAP